MGNRSLPLFFILLQRVPADIESQYFFFKSQQIFFSIFRHLWNLNLKSSLILFRCKIKKTDLTCEVFLLFLCGIIHNLSVDHHHLTPIGRKTVKGTCLDKVFYCTLINLMTRHPVDEIRQIFKITSFFPFLNDLFNHRFSYTFNGIKSITDSTV